VTWKQKFISIGVNTSCDTDFLVFVELKFSCCQSLEVILHKTK